LGDTGARALAHDCRYLAPSLDGEPYEPLPGRAVGAEYDQFHRPFNTQAEPGDLPELLSWHVILILA
jgi:hypothetical protein